MTQALPLISRYDIQSAVALLKSESLRYEDDLDDLVGLFDQGELIACGARSLNVLKMLVVDKNHRGGSILGEIVTALINRDESPRSEAYFIFTKPCAVASFERLNFRVLARHKKAVLLENQNGINRFLRRLADRVTIGNNAGIVINADPFTLGHLSIIEAASRDSSQVYVFVPTHGRFTFDSQTRLEWAQHETQHLPNVQVINAESYLLHESIFPGYFLPLNEDKEQLRLEMALTLFINHLAPYFSIKRRYVGEEPVDPEVREHHTLMEINLSNAGIQTVKLPRRKSNNLWVSTQQVKHDLNAGNLEKLRGQLPEFTFQCIQANASQPR